MVRTYWASRNLQRLKRSAILTVRDHLATSSSTPPVHSPSTTNSSCLYQGALKPSKESISLCLHEGACVLMSVGVQLLDRTRLNCDAVLWQCRVSDVLLLHLI